MQKQLSAKIINIARGIIMSNKSITVTCGQCKSFIPKSEESNGFSDDNGRCATFDTYAKDNGLLANSAYFIHTLGGIPINSELPRQCQEFQGKYAFVGGE